MRVRAMVIAAGTAVLLACVPAEDSPQSAPSATEPLPAESTPADPADPSSASERSASEGASEAPAIAEGPPAEDLDVAYTQSFSGRRTRWPTGRSDVEGILATTHVRDGAYLGSVQVRAPAKSGSHRMLAPEILHGFRDVEVSVRVRKVGTTGGAGVLCFQDDDVWEGYEFAIDSDGWAGISKRDAFDSYSVLADDHVPELIRPHGGNLLSGRCTSSAGRVDLVLTLNGHEVLRTADVRPDMQQDGQAGVHMGTNRRGRVDVAFEDFQVRAAVEAAGRPPALEPTEEPSDALAEVTFLEDPFDDPFSGWNVMPATLARGGQVTDYRRGAYAMQVRPPSFGFVSPAPIDGDPPEGDVAVEAAVRIPSGRGNAGVFCRGAPDLATAYLAGVGTRGGYGILRIGGNAPRPLTEPGTTDPALRDVARWNTVRLECLGTEDDTTLRLYANDRLIAEVVDPEPLPDAGEVGLFVMRAGAGRTIDALFDDFLAERQSPST